jgi:hypothetical protein
MRHHLQLYRSPRWCSGWCACYWTHESRVQTRPRRWILRAIKTRSTPSFGWEVKQEALCRKNLRQVKDPLTYLTHWYAKFSLLRPFLLLAPRCLLVGLPENSGGRVRFPQPASSPPHALHAHISPGGWTIGPLAAAVERPKSDPIDMINQYHLVYSYTHCFLTVG